MLIKSNHNEKIQIQPQGNFRNNLFNWSVLGYNIHNVQIIHVIREYEKEPI